METVIGTKITIDTSEGAKSLRTLKAEYKEQQKELEQAVAGTEQYTNALKKLANTKDEIDDLNDAINAQTGAGKFEAFAKVGSSIASGFAAAEGAMALFGSESEDLQKALVKVQAAMALAEGLKGLEGIGDALKNVKGIVLDLWKTLIANPFIAILAGVAALTAAVYAFSKANEEGADDVAKLTSELEAQKLAAEDLHRTNEASINSMENQLKIMKAQGAGAKELKEQQDKLNEVKIKDLEISIQTLHTATLLEQATLKQVAANDSLLESGWLLQAQVFRKLGQDKTADTFEAIAAKNKQERLAEQTKKVQEAQKAEQDAIISLQNLRTEIKVQEITDEKERNEAYKKFLEERRRLTEEAKAAEEEQKSKAAKLLKQEIENQAELEQEKQHKADLANISFNSALIQQQIREEEAEKLKQWQKLEDEEAIAKRKALTKAIIGIEQQVFDTVTALGNLAFKDQKKHQEFDRKVAAVKLAIDTAKAISGAVAQAQSVPFPGNLAAIATGVATVIANIAKAKQLLSSAGETGLPDVSGGGSGGGGNTGNFSQPLLGTGVSNNSTLLNQNGTVNNPTPPPQKVYIVQSEITEAGKTENSILNKAKIE
jgi:hypothetical protein